MKNLTKAFLRGFFIIVPVFLTCYFVFWLLTVTENVFKVPLQATLPGNFYFPGLGLLSALLFTVLVGILARIYIINLLFKAFEKLLNSLPLIKQVYGSIRDLTRFLDGTDKEDLQQVVAININGVRLVGFVTADNAALGKGNIQDNKDSDSDKDENLISVYLPMSYQVGGYLVYVPESMCEKLDMPVREAMQTILTANIASN